MYNYIFKNFNLQLDTPDGILKDDLVKRTPDKFSTNA